MDQNLMTIDELSQKLKVPKSFIYSRTRQRGPGCIPVIRVGKYLRFKLDDVMEWLEKKQEAGR